MEKINDNKINANDFIVWFYEYIVLTVITCPSQDSAIQIFNVLNDRGMPLSSIDILKSSLMQKLDGKEDRNAFKTTWEEIDSKLRFANLDLDGLLTTFLYYKIAANPKSRLDKELLSVFQKEKKSSLSIVKEIADFTNAFVELIGKEDKSIYCLRYLRHKIYWNSILATAIYVNYLYFDELKELLVAYYYQNWIAGATVARIKQTSFNILKHVKKQSEIKLIKKEMKENLKKYSTSKTFEEEIEGSWVYGRKWDRAILILIEYFSSDNSNQSYIPINNKLHLEHILPQTPTSDWTDIFDEEERERWTDALANLTLLSMKKNIQAKNYSFTKKKKAYQNDNVVSSFLITQDVIQYEDWDNDTLEKRKETLLTKINEKLDLF